MTQALGSQRGALLIVLHRQQGAFQHVGGFAAFCLQFGHDLPVFGFGTNETGVCCGDAGCVAGLRSKRHAHAKADALTDTGG